MARASQVTWVSLDRFAEVMGINPMHFNGAYSTLLPTADCSDVWRQYAWQDANKVSREDIARAIHDAEQRIAEYLGYNLIPDWTADERVRTVRPNAPELYNRTGTGARRQFLSVQARRGFVQMGGLKARSVIQAGAAIVRSDADGDGYSETATVTVANTTVDACEIRVFHAGKSGADEWEIKPATVTKSGNTATIKFKIWQAIDDNLWEGHNASDIDGDAAASFETTVDVYRVYNDASQQVQFLWEQPNCSSCGGSGCTACTLSTQYGCLTVRDTRRGILAYRPATYDASDGSWSEQSYIECRAPDRLRLWYQSGWRDEGRTCPEKEMDRALERAVCYYAAALLSRKVCTCQNVEQFFEYWREDLAMTNATRSYQLAARVTENPFGTTRGAVNALSVCQDFIRKAAR